MYFSLRRVRCTPNLELGRLVGARGVHDWHLLFDVQLTDPLRAAPRVKVS